MAAEKQVREFAEIVNQADRFATKAECNRQLYSVLKMQLIIFYRLILGN
jgi:hypothetical protein